MSEVTIDIYPGLPEAGGVAMPLSETLSQEEFSKLDGDYVSRYLIQDKYVDYGKVDLYSIYVDTCEEIDKLNDGGDHDITMSFYPVLRVFDLGEDYIKIDNISDVSPEPRINSVITSRGRLLAQLVNVKHRIESMAINWETNGLPASRP